MTRITEFKMIVALCRGGGIGYQGHLPWPKLARDMRFFAQMTRSSTAAVPYDSAVVMGRKTWDSLPLSARPLKYRDNIVVSLMSHPTVADADADADASDTGVTYITTINDIREHAKNYDVVWIIGGASIYEQILANKTVPIDEIYITFIDETYEYDSVFPLMYQYDTIEQLLMLRNNPLNRTLWCWNDASVVPPLVSFSSNNNDGFYYRVEDVERDFVSNITRQDDITGIRERRIPDMRFLRLKRLLAV